MVNMDQSKNTEGTKAKIEPPFISAKIATNKGPSAIILSRDLRHCEGSATFDMNAQDDEAIQHPKVAW